MVMDILAPAPVTVSELPRICSGSRRTLRIKNTARRRDGFARQAEESSRREEIIDGVIDWRIVTVGYQDDMDDCERGGKDEGEGGEQKRATTCLETKCSGGSGCLIHLLTNDVLR